MRSLLLDVWKRALSGLTSESPAPRVSLALLGGPGKVLICSESHFDLSPTTQFGGVKESGIGVEWGVEGLKSFCNAQVIVVKK